MIGWQRIRTAPKDGTPVLLVIKAEEELPVNGKDLANIQFVGRNRGDYAEWGFAAPVGYAGIPDEWIKGWMPLPPNDKQTL